MSDDTRQRDEQAGNGSNRSKDDDKASRGDQHGASDANDRNREDEKVQDGATGRDGQDEDTGDGNAGQGDDDVIKVARTPTSPALLTRLQHRRAYRQADALGAGRTGAATFWMQRVTALALIPLAIWFAVNVVRMSTATRAWAAHWLAFPVNAVLMALFIVFALRHASIGVQIILEDYVEGDGARTFWILLVKALAVVLGAAAVAALIRLLIA